MNAKSNRTDDDWTELVDDVAARPTVWVDQHGDTGYERTARTRIRLERCKDALLDQLQEPQPVESRLRLDALLKDVKVDIDSIRRGAPIGVLRDLDRKWR